MFRRRFPLHARLSVPLALLVITASAVPLGTMTSASAETRDEQAADLKAEFRESSKVASDAYAAADQLKRKARLAREAATDAQREVDAAAERERVATATAERARQAAGLAEERVTAAKNALGDAQDELGQVARSLYIQGPMTTANAVLNAQDLTAMSREVEMTRWAGKWQERRIIAFDKARAEQLDASLALTEQREAAERLEAEATALADTARRAQAAAARTSRDANRLSARAVATMRSARAAAADDEARYRAFQAETQRLKNALRNGSTRPTGPSSSGLVLPVPGGVSSPYGMRSHPVTGVYKLHTGVDLSAGCGTPVIAAANGRVESAGYDSAYGNRIVIRHGLIKGKDVATTYNHQSRLGVRAGQTVSQGQVIGWVGTTGLSTGCHMHFEVLVNGSFVNPMAF